MDFRGYAAREIGGDIFALSEFLSRTPQHVILAIKLNRLGSRNTHMFGDELPPNVDATVVLSDDEWNSLEADLRALLRS